MLPLRVFRDRNRAGAYIGMLLVSFGPMGMFYLLNLYLQYVLGYGPLETGLAWLPFAFGIVLGAGVSAKLVVRSAPRVIVASGMVITALGLLALSRIGSDTSFWLHLMPAIFATAFGFALNFVPLTGAGVNSAAQKDAGIASALLNAGQQLGTALGVAVVSSIAVAVTQQQLPDAVSRLAAARARGDVGLVEQAKNALIDGYSAGMLVGAIVLALAAVVTATIINAKRPDPQSREPAA
jgi:predicted MFS family arabinose efflux permease